MGGDHMGRTDSGELIGPYDTAEQLNRELEAANLEQGDSDYIVHVDLRLRLQHIEGPQPTPELVKAAVITVLAGETLHCTVDGKTALLLIDDAEVR